MSPHGGEPGEGVVPPDDAEWDDIVRDYAEALPARAEAIATALEAARHLLDRDALIVPRRLAHRLFGTAGSYGFAAIGAVAGRIEDELVAGAADEAGLDVAAWQRLRDAADELRALAAAAAEPDARVPGG